jgi:hypothetical protein
MIELIEHAFDNNAPSRFTQDRLFATMIAILLYEGSELHAQSLMESYVKNCRNVEMLNFITLIKAISKYDAQNNKESYMNHLNNLRYKTYPPFYDDLIQAFFEETDPNLKNALAKKIINHFIGFQTLSNFEDSKVLAEGFSDKELIRFFDEFYPLVEGPLLRSQIFTVFVDKLDNPINILDRCNQYFIDKIISEEILNEHELGLLVFHLNGCIAEKACDKMDLNFKKLLSEQPFYILSYSQTMLELCKLNDSYLSEKEVLKRIYSSIQNSYQIIHQSYKKSKLQTVNRALSENLLELLKDLNTFPKYHAIKMETLESLKSIEKRPGFRRVLLALQLDLNLEMNKKVEAYKIFKEMLLLYDGLEKEEKLKIELLTTKAKFFKKMAGFEALLKSELLMSELNDYEDLETTIVDLLSLYQ